MEDSTLSASFTPIAAAADRRVRAALGRTDSTEASLWLVVFASVTLDVYTTWLGLSAGLTEGNPAMHWAIDGFGFGALVAAKLAVLVAAALLREARPGDGRVIALGLALPWGLTVVVNVVTLATV